MRGRANGRRTAVFLLVVVILALLGRIVAGPTFGAVMWVAFMAPWGVSVGHDIENGLFRSMGAIFSVSAVACLPLAGVVDPSVWCRLVLLIALWAGLLLNVRRVAEPVLGVDVGRCLLTVGWLAWWAGPLWFGRHEAAIGWVEHTPILILMGQVPLLGDWSHQAIAYDYLTRLGQDTAFEVPSQRSGVTWTVIEWSVSGALAFGARVKSCSTWNK